MIIQTTGSSIMTAAKNKTSGNSMHQRRLVIVVRADPVICGHSGEARNLAEVALQRGFTDVRILTWPLDLLTMSGLPLKPLEGVLPYSKGIEVERPEPIGDYKVLDGRHLAGMTGRLVELFTDGVPTVCMSLYLSPHTLAVSEALRVARSTGLPVSVATIAEAVGSDVTNVVRSCAADGRLGAAAQVLSAYLDSDVPVAVSDYTKDLIISSAEEIDASHGTSFAERCRHRVAISYPAINTADYLRISGERTMEVLTRRGLMRDGYVLYLSRLARAKGVDDLITGFDASPACKELTLVIAGNGPEAEHLRELSAATSAANRIIFLDDVDDDEKPHLMAGCAAFVLPSKPRPEFVETFGIALVEKMLAGGGPVITTNTGGIGEAVGDTAMIVPVSSPEAIADALDLAVTMPIAEQTRMAERAREHARQFDRACVFDRLLQRLAEVTRAGAQLNLNSACGKPARLCEPARLRERACVPLAIHTLQRIPCDWSERARAFQRRHARFQSARLRRCWSLPDGDMLGAVAGKWLAIPAAPALPQGHACKPRHQVELGGPYIAEGRREHLKLAVGDPVVMGNQALARDVVLVEPQPGISHSESPDCLTGRQPLQIRHTDLNDETPTGQKMISHVLEARDLLILRRQIHDRVEDQVGERKTACNSRRGEVTNRHGDLICAWLGTQPGDHRVGEVDAMDPNAALRKRQRNTPCADAKLQSLPIGGQLGEEIHNWVDLSRLEHVGGRVVVALRNLLTEVVLRHIGCPAGQPMFASSATSGTSRRH